ncbi:hypothetical protein L873DRAFT_1042803 [Choiromyces venosus 120613-1]|uniref:Uncharacterized protein n=1 Tax=Choiromyces venosus 120613-1 TaxID=1336337 RepID=A0A3N4JXI6_9PEZI|nr:hypothetical protein L873DRAFT_1042803 [Choiromyces venosus 120613-1]
MGTEGFPLPVETVALGFIASIITRMVISCLSSRVIMKSETKLLADYDGFMKGLFGNLLFSCLRSSVHRWKNIILVVRKFPARPTTGATRATDKLNRFR